MTQPALAAAQRPNTYVGAPIERVEDFRFLRGRGTFLDDLSRPGQWHAAFVRSTRAHGTIRNIGTRPALAMRGVRAIITGADIGSVPTIPFRRPNPTIAPYAQPVIAATLVRYVGEPVAMVLADSPELAEDAAHAVELDIAPLPVVADRSASVAGRTLLFPGTTSNCATTFTAETGGRRGGVPRRPLCASRILCGAAPDRLPNGDPRPPRRMGCGGGTAHHVGCRQAALLQSPHARRLARSSRAGGRLYRI
jgi:hypothetical protein